MREEGEESEVEEGSEEEVEEDQVEEGLDEDLEDDEEEDERMGGPGPSNAWGYEGGQTLYCY